MSKSTQTTSDESLYYEQLIKCHRFIQFYRKIRTVYINTKTVQDLLNVLNVMLTENSFTINIEGTDYGYFLGSKLYLIDIRYNTYYKSKRSLPNNKAQWFGPDTLTELFQSYENIEYYYLRGLGNPAEFRKNEAYKNNPDKQRELYLQYLQSNHKKFATKNEFDLLYKLALKWQNQLCLMCYCPPKEKPKNTEKIACHRFWVKEALVNQYYRDHGFSGSITIDHYPENHFENQYKIQINALGGNVS